MRVTDYIAEVIYKQGVDTVFMVAGGGMMFLSDGIAMHPHLEAVCTHHEQAAAMAAVSYAKYRSDLGVCYVTTGCGGTNAVTGLLNAWQDSTPCLFVSGQSKRKETIRNSGLRLRQFGVQEADIIEIVQTLTKYAVMVNKPELIAYHLDKAIFLAKHGRPGPVWLDIPLDVQGASVDPRKMQRFSGADFMGSNPAVPTDSEIQECLEAIKKADRPIVIAGQGIRLGKAINEFKAFVEKLQVPFVVSKLGIDLLPATHQLYIGRIGNKGDRPGNLAVQNADLIISVGCRLSVSSTGHEYANFGRAARIIVVDIDPVEHQKNTVRIDSFIHSDARVFLDKILNQGSLPPRSSWLTKCQHWKTKYPVFRPEYADDSQGINLYYFIDCISEVVPDNGAVVWDAGATSTAVGQALRLMAGQRSITSGGQGEMGYALPASIGVCYARGKKQVIGITGDGSLQMNIQELQTIVHNNLPIKIFVTNNDGYLSIRATQSRFFDGRFIGTDSRSGVSFPSLKKIAAAYGITYSRLSSCKNLKTKLKDVVKLPRAVLCEVMCIRDQEIVPTVASTRKDDGTMISKPLEDMYPFLPREEFLDEMIVEPIPE